MSATLAPLATLQPPCNSRTWMSTPHPYLPIIATACSDKTVRIYSLRDFQQQSSIGGGHKRSVRSCAWKGLSGTAAAAAASGESVLATGSFDASCGVWKRWEQQNVQEIDFTGSGLSGGGGGGGNGNGDHVDDDDEEEWRLEVILEGHDSEIKSLAFCPTAPLLATSSRDKSVWIWEELDDDDDGGGGAGENFETMAVLQEHAGDVKCVGWHPAEKCLASGSYDDDVRIWREDGDDWGCCAVLRGHGGTVWWVEFEGKAKEGWESSGPRLMSCSDDATVRVWRRKAKEKREDQAPGLARMPSIWKNRDFEEEWFEEGRLPQVHDRPVYAINWSRKTGKVVSAGSDGKIVVYEERTRTPSTSVLESKEVDMTDATPPPTSNSHDESGQLQTEWVVFAEVENAHDVFEVNHVVWAPRADKGKRYEGEEVIVSTGDDGEVKVWTLEE